MDLIERIKGIAKQYELPESDLILEEVELFLVEHKRHGSCKIVLEYNQKEDSLDIISLECLADKIIDRDVCPHNNPKTLSELTFSIIYSKEKTAEGEIQKLRREGRIDRYGNKIILYS